MKKFTIIAVSFVLILVGFVGQASAAGFADVNPKHQFKEEIDYLIEKKIINGYEGNLFKPQNSVTRGDAALMIARARGLDLTKRKTDFTDVHSSMTASGAIQSAYKDGIITGYSDGSFRPEETVTRGQMAMFLARAFDLSIEHYDEFSDVPVSSNAYSSIRRILAEGITGGYSNGTYRPEQTLTRDQFSGFVARALSEEFKLSVNACGYVPSSKTNPDFQTVNCLLTTAALTSEGVAIPPEIVKGVALEEKNDWKHFLSNGEPYISGDNGIGLMQITETTGFQVDKLKYDLTYNINAGITMLKKNFGLPVLPTVGSKSPNSLESWYFAVMAYNGVVAENSPFVKATGKRNSDAYQEKVYAHIGENGLKTTNIENMNMTSNDFHYGEDTNWIIRFNKNHIEVDGQETPSSERFVAGDLVRSSVQGRLRTEPTTSGSSPYTTISSSDDIHILGGPLYDENRNSTNSFIWYPAMVVKNGKKVYGYIASSNLKKK